MKKYFAALALIATYINVSAQNTPSIPEEGVEITKAIAASPDAVALGKYGAVPVSLYTGVPNITIPFYNISCGSIYLPISLSYHSGGNKVEEMASSVGLGWVLNAGGVITRTIRGKADEDLLGFLDHGHYVTNILSTVNTNSPYNYAQLNNYLDEISDGSMDGEADMYNFNFGSYSGRFVMDTYGNVTTIPQTRIKFTFAVGVAPDGPPMITSFTALTPDGLLYTFGDDNDGNNAYETTANYSSCALGSVKPKYYATSWFLKKITDPTGHQVTFNYTTENYNITLNKSDTRYQFYSNSPNGSPIPSMPEKICSSVNSIRGSKLSSIIFANGSINFHVSSRNDVSNTNLIDSLSIAGGGLFKNYRLYYTNNSTSRLRLDSLADYVVSPSQESNVKVERYKFQYNSDQSWKSYVGNNQDYWGYNNGAGNTTLSPAMLFYPSGSSTPVLITGADRSANEGAMLGGMLTKIIYPTGGYTTFNYEANQESNLDLGGSSPKYPPTLNEFAKCNDPASSLYNYDVVHDNPEDVMTITSKSSVSVAVGLTATGLETDDANINDVTANLVKLDASGNPLPNGPNGGLMVRNTDTIVYLTPGTYHLVITDGKNKAYPTGTVKYSIDINWQTANPHLFQNYIVGGLRIQQIADYDGINPNPVNVKTYQYTAQGATTSSGWLDFQPVYNYYLGINGGNVYQGIYTNTFFVQNSVSNYPLATTQGSVVGYSDVTELDGANGKTEYLYTNSQSDPDYAAFTQLYGSSDNGFPFPPPITHDWRRGLLLKQTTYKSTSDTTYAIVQDKSYGYSSLYGGFMDNIKAGFTTKPAQYAETGQYLTNNNLGDDGIMSVAKYTDYTDFTYLTTMITTDYNGGDPTKYVQTTMNYQMDSTTLQVSNISTVNSKNEKTVQSVTYPPSYNTNAVNGSASMAGISKLQALGIMSYPIEEVIQKSNLDGSNLRTVKAVLTTYKPTMPARDSIYTLQSVQPVTGFIKSYSGSAYINKDSHYLPVVNFQQYDRNGNILQENKIGAPLHSYIWGYPDQYSPNFINTYPIAEVVNADTSNIAYTNFESFAVSGTGYGNWVYSNAGMQDGTAPMGAGCYQLSSGNITKSNLAVGKSYIVSVRAKSGTTITIGGGTVISKPAGPTLNGWTYFEYQVTGATTITVGGSGLIDELRLHPTDAQMTTYTYTPLIGLSSTCNAKSEITYYLYDSLGRLTDVKDQYGNILKHTDYHYQGN